MNRKITKAQAIAYLELFEDFRYGGGDEAINSGLNRSIGFGHIAWGGIIVSTLTIPAGEYAVVDLAPSEFSNSGQPHVNMGMLQQITVSE